MSVDVCVCACSSSGDLDVSVSVGNKTLCDTECLYVMSSCCDVCMSASDVSSVRRAAALLPSAVPSETGREESTAQGPNVPRSVRMTMGVETCTGVSTQSF